MSPRPPQRCDRHFLVLEAGQACPQCVAAGNVPEYLKPTYAPSAQHEDNPKKAFGDAKVPLQLVPPAMDVYVALGLREGAEKYGAWNWRKTNVEVMTYVGAIRRHLADFVDGVDTDPDSPNGKPSLAGCAASLAILIDAITGGFAIDNRPPPGAAARLFAQHSRTPETKGDASK